MLSIIVIIILSYLAGSIPTSVIMSKLTRGIDLWDHSSVNVRATNVRELEQNQDLYHIDIK